MVDGFSIWHCFGYSRIFDSGLSLHVGWQIIACFVLTASEVMVSITCLEFAYTQAPKAMKSLVMACFYLQYPLAITLLLSLNFCLLTRGESLSLLEQMNFGSGQF